MRRSFLRFLRMLSGGLRGAADGLLDPLSPHGLWITVRFRDLSTVTVWLDPHDLTSIGQFVDTVRAAESGVPRTPLETP